MFLTITIAGLKVGIGAVLLITGWFILRKSSKDTFVVVALVFDGIGDYLIADILGINLVSFNSGQEHSGSPLRPTCGSGSQRSPMISFVLTGSPHFFLMGIPLIFIGLWLLVLLK